MERQAAAIDAFSGLLADARSVLIFTGAGISTESGIDDFRSPGGIWSRIKPIPFERYVSDEEARLEDWNRRFHFKALYESVQPNAGHRAVASLVESQAGLGVVTQNIDGLHQRSGVADERVLELHGSGLRASCLDCAAPVTLPAVEQHIETTGRPPACDRCGGIVKADVVSFGQPMPQQKLREALVWAKTCDLCIVLGSSLVVQPAASVPEIAARNGAALVIVNREPTPLDVVATLTIASGIGETMEAVVNG